MPAVQLGPWRPAVRWSLAGVCWGVYAGVLVAARDVLGGAVAAVVLLPAVGMAALWGRRGGLWGGALGVLATLAYFTLHEGQPLRLASLQGGFGYLLTVVGAYLAGWAAETVGALHADRARLREEVARREEAVRLARIHEQEAIRHQEEARRLQEVAAFKTRFLNNAAHELATPLTAIHLQMATMREVMAKDMGQAPRRALDLLDRNLDRLNLLVQDLLDAARLQGGHLKMAPRPMALPRVVGDMAASLSREAKQKGVALEAEPGGADLRVVGDEARLGQVLFNLVHNALKFTPQGGRVRVSARRDGAHVVLAVQDTGMGFTAEQAGRLFQPFSQVHDTAHVPPGGTGLGLYISRGIVEQHGGTLSCASVGPGQGSTFTVRLPVAPEPTP